MKKILIVGFGGHSKSCVEVINNLKKYKISYYLTKEKKDISASVLFYDRKNLIKIFNKNIKLAHIGIGQITNLRLRSKIYSELIDLRFNLPKIVSKSSYLSKSSIIGDGSIIMNHAIVNTNVSLGNNVIINNGAIVEHDCIIGDDVHIAPGAIINGGVKIGNNCFIGSGAVIKQQITIPPFTIVQAGRVILGKNDL
tara:strand:+ start:3053 stop:3640 length:588 start_codon:yes stop_codon:yes gene_type:complete